MSNLITVVVCANADPIHDYLIRGFRALRESCKKFGVELIISGWHEPWRGLGSKPSLLKRAIENGSVKTDHIIFADAFDVVFSHSPEAIFAEWERLFPAKEIVWNAEMNCWPDAQLVKYHAEIESPFRYLNSGLSIGRTEDYLLAMRQMKVDEWPDEHQMPNGAWYRHDDQNEWMHKYLFKQSAPDDPKIQLDHNCQLFQAVFGVAEDSFDCETMQNKVTGGFPMAFHFNGPAKSSPLFDKILTKLGY